MAEDKSNYVEYSYEEFVSRLERTTRNGNYDLSFLGQTVVPDPETPGRYFLMCVVSGVPPVWTEHNIGPGDTLLRFPAIADFPIFQVLKKQGIAKIAMPPRLTPLVPIVREDTRWAFMDHPDIMVQNLTAGPTGVTAFIKGQQVVDLLALSLWPDQAFDGVIYPGVRLDKIGVSVDGHFESHEVLGMPGCEFTDFGDRSTLAVSDYVARLRCDWTGSDKTTLLKGSRIGVVFQLRVSVELNVDTGKLMSLFKFDGICSLDIDGQSIGHASDRYHEVEELLKSAEHGFTLEAFTKPAKS